MRAISLPTKISVVHRVLDGERLITRNTNRNFSIHKYSLLLVPCIQTHSYQCQGSIKTTTSSRQSSISHDPWLKKSVTSQLHFPLLPTSKQWPSSHSSTLVRASFSVNTRFPKSTLNLRNTHLRSCIISLLIRTSSNICLYSKLSVRTNEILSSSTVLVRKKKKCFSSKVIWTSTFFLSLHDEGSIRTVLT